MWKQSDKQTPTHTTAPLLLTLRLAAAAAIVGSALLTHRMSSSCGTAASHIGFLESACCPFFFFQNFDSGLGMIQDCSSHRLISCQMRLSHMLSFVVVLFCFTHSEWTEVKVMFVLSAGLTFIIEKKTEAM